MEHIKTHYSDKCVDSSNSYVSRTMPVKMAYCSNLSQLPYFQYPRELLFLSIYVKNFEHPNEDGWENYETLFALSPKLQGIQITTKKGQTWYFLQDLLNKLPQKIQEIWNKRIDYLQSRNINLRSVSEYESKALHL
jgi:hypothetical protein